MTNDFLTLGVRRETSIYLREMGITEPTPVQVQAIPMLMAGKDVVAQSQTGTGKTLAFLLPILENIQINKPYAQALVVTPTRELALQITKEAKKLADKLGIAIVSIYGGQALEKQINQLKGNPHVIIGTPGRLLDHIRRKTLNLAGVAKLVLDEADQMLHMGFLDDVEEIIRQTAGNRQTILFSATMPPRIRALAARYMDRPADIRVQKRNVTLDEIKQMVVETSEEEKLDRLCRMIDEYRPYLAMVFCHTKQRVSDLTIVLTQRGYAVDELHGDLSQTKREYVMRRFRNTKLQILVATDIAARGLDIEGITHVFNYDIPHDVESYIHRIGRTGRAGQTGTAVTFVTPGEQQYLRMIEQGIRASIRRQKAKESKVVAPTGEDRDLDSPARTAGEERKAAAVPAFAKKPTSRQSKSHGGINLRSRRKPKTAGESPSRSSYKTSGKLAKRRRSS